MAQLLQAHGQGDYKFLIVQALSPQDKLAVHYRPQHPLVVYGKEIKEKDIKRAIAGLYRDSVIWPCALDQSATLAARGLYGLLHRHKSKEKGVILLHAPMDLADDGWMAVADRLKKRPLSLSPPKRNSNPWRALANKEIPKQVCLNSLQEVCIKDYAGMRSPIRSLEI